MTFKDIILANIKRSYKKYFSYFFSGLFCVMMFFVFSTLVFNPSIQQTENDYPLVLYLWVSVISIMLFSFFFITYAHYSFMKNRNKEFGIYMMLGLTNKDVKRMIILENLIIASLSIISGIVLGALFSRFIQMLVLYFLEIDTYTTSLNYKSFVLTLGTFVVVYIVALFITLRRINKLDVSTLVKTNRLTYKPFQKKHLWFCLVGIVMMILSLIINFSYSQDNTINTKPFFMIPYLSFSLLGLILVIIYGGKTLFYYIRRTKYYYKNIISVTQGESKFNQNSKIMTILAILAALISLSIGAPFALLNLTDKVVRDSVNDIEYIYFLDKKDFNQATLDDLLIATDGTKSSFELAYVYDKDDLSSPRIIMSTSAYNEYYHTDYYLNDNECFGIILSWEPGDHGLHTGKDYNGYLGDSSVNYRIKGAEKNRFITDPMGFMDTLLLVNDSTYQVLLNASDDRNKASFNMIDLTMNYKDSGDLVNQYHTCLGENVKIGSRYETYKSLRSGYAAFMFISATESIMFFISTGAVLFFKQVNEMEEIKKEFYKLYKIGISKREVKKTIYKELAVVYFIPSIFGGIIGLSIMYYMTNLFSVSGNDFLLQFMQKGFIAWLIYFALQALCYLLSVNKYKVEILHNVY